MSAKTKKAPKQPTFFQERRFFIKRILGENVKEYSKEMLFTKKIFEKFNNDIDFLNNVKPPQFLKDSLAWFLCPEGIKYLERKHKEFHFQIEEYEKPVEVFEKAGDDVYVKQPRTIREFLYGS